METRNGIPRSAVGEEAKLKAAAERTRLAAEMSKLQTEVTRLKEEQERLRKEVEAKANELKQARSELGSEQRAHAETSSSLSRAQARTVPPFDSCAALAWQAASS